MVLSIAVQRLSVDLQRTCAAAHKPGAGQHMANAGGAAKHSQAGCMETVRCMVMKATH